MTLPAPGGPESRSIPEYLALVLDTVVGVFEQAGVDVPKRRYWTLGGVPADCEQLTVHLTQVYKGNPGDDPGQVQRCGSARSASLVVQLFRPVPTGNGQKPPSPEIIMREAEPSAIDAWLLLDAAEAIDAAGWNTGLMAEVNVIDPSGGFVGLSMTLTAPIP